MVLPVDRLTRTYELPGCFLIGMMTWVTVDGLHAFYTTKLSMTIPVPSVPVGHMDIIVHTREQGRIDAREATRGVQVHITASGFVERSASRILLRLGATVTVNLLRRKEAGSLECICFDESLLQGAGAVIDGTAGDGAGSVLRFVRDTCGLTAPLTRREQLMLLSSLSALAPMQEDKHRSELRGSYPEHRIVLFGLDSAVMHTAFLAAVHGVVWESRLGFRPVFVLLGDEWATATEASPLGTIRRWLTQREWRVVQVSRAHGDAGGGLEVWAKLTAVFAISDELLAGFGPNPYILSADLSVLPLHDAAWNADRDWSKPIHLFDAFGIGDLKTCSHGNAAPLFGQIPQVSALSHVGMTRAAWTEVLRLDPSQKAQDGVRALPQTLRPPLDPRL